MHIRVKQLSVIFIIACLWEILPTLELLDPVFVPALHNVILTIVGLAQRGNLLHHVWLSTFRALGGFAIAVIIGIPLGFLIGSGFPRFRAVAEPLLDLFAQANPVVLFHVVILFLGIDEAPKLFIVAWLCTCSITFSTIAGTRNVDTQLIKIGRSFGLTKVKLFVKIVLPSSAPTIFTGLRLAAGYAFTMLIAAEAMGASSGLGWYIIQSQESYYAPRIFAAATIITLLALVADGALKCLEAMVIDWKPALETPNRRSA